MSIQFQFEIVAAIEPQSQSYSINERKHYQLIKFSNEFVLALICSLALIEYFQTSTHCRGAIT